MKLTSFTCFIASAFIFVHILPYYKNRIAINEQTTKLQHYFLNVRWNFVHTAQGHACGCTEIDVSRVSLYCFPNLPHYRFCVLRTYLFSWHRSFSSGHSCALQHRTTTISYYDSLALYRTLKYLYVYVNTIYDFLYVKTDSSCN